MLAAHALPRAEHTAPLDGLRGYLALEDGPLELGVVGAGGAGDVTITPGEDEEVEDVMARLRAALPAIAPADPAWPATSACGGAKPRLAMGYPEVGFAVRAEPPRPGDVVLVVGEDRVVDRALPIAYAVGRPVVLAVRDDAGQPRALPIRLCADAAQPAPRTAGAVELQLVTTTELGAVAARSTGHARRDDILIERASADAAALGAMIHALAYDATPAAVRLRIRANVSIARVVTGLEALVASGAGALAVTMADPQIDVLTASVAAIAVTGEVEAATVRRGVVGQLERLAVCLERAVFDGSGDRMRVQVAWSGPSPLVTVAPPPGPASAGCVEAVLAGLKGGHSRVAAGTATIELAVGREDAERRPRGPAPYLHGHLP